MDTVFCSIICACILYRIFPPELPRFSGKFRPRKKAGLVLIVTDRCLRLGADAAGGLRRQTAGEEWCGMLGLMRWETRLRPMIYCSFLRRQLPGSDRRHAAVHSCEQALTISVAERRRNAPVWNARTASKRFLALHSTSRFYLKRCRHYRLRCKSPIHTIWSLFRRQNATTRCFAVVASRETQTGKDYRAGWKTRSWVRKKTGRKNKNEGRRGEMKGKKKREKGMHRKTLSHLPIS